MHKNRLTISLILLALPVALIVFGGCWPAGQYGHENRRSYGTYHPRHHHHHSRQYDSYDHDHARHHDHHDTEHHEDSRDQEEDDDDESLSDDRSDLEKRLKKRK